MNKTVLINRPISESEVNEIARLAENGATIFTLPGGHLSNVAHRIELSPEVKREINYSTMAEVLGFGDLLIGDQTLAELFSVENASVWHYQKFRVYFCVRNLMYFLKPIQQHFSSLDDHVWFVSSEIKPLQHIYPEVDFRVQSEKAKTNYNFSDIFSYLVLIKYRILSFLFSAKKKPEYLLYLTEKYSNILDRKTLNPSSGHHILEYLISELDERFALLTEVLMPKPKGKSDYSYSGKQYQRYWNHSPKIFLEGILLSGLLNNRVRKSANKAVQAISLCYPEVRKVELSVIHRITLEVFHSLNKSSSFFLFRYFAAKNYFAGSGIKAVIAADENSPLTKSILDAAKFCGIRIVGLQHGTMHDLHPAYLYTPNDRKNRVMPDLTLTWGTYWEDFLIEKGNYTKESVVSVGQIRTDIIPALLLSEKPKTANPIEKIVFASQPQRDPELRYQSAFDVFKAAQNMPNASLIVKLHPREFNDSEYYMAIAKEAGCSNYQLDTTSDLYQLIASCHVLITCFSTVGTETVYFHKPLVILDHLKQDVQGYVAEGVAFQAPNADNLTEILAGILRGTLKIDPEKYDAFIQKYAFRIDGKVAERCIRAITSAK